jgi:hypothetical protein
MPQPQPCPATSKSSSARSLPGTECFRLYGSGCREMCGESSEVVTAPLRCLSTTAVHTHAPLYPPDLWRRHPFCWLCLFYLPDRRGGSSSGGSRLPRMDASHIAVRRTRCGRAPDFSHDNWIITVRLFLGAPPISTSFLVRQAVDTRTLVALTMVSGSFFGGGTRTKKKRSLNNLVPEGERSNDLHPTYVKILSTLQSDVA